MGDFYINSSSQNQSYNETNSTSVCTGATNVTFCLHSILYVVTCIVICVGLPLILMGIYSLYSQVRSDHVTPIYVINLLVTDLIQLCFMVVVVVSRIDWTTSVILYDIYVYCLLVSVGFMVCVAMERYLVIVHPLWYRCRRTIKSTVVVCVVVWLIPLVYILTLHLGGDFKATYIICGIFLLLPLPLLIYFLVATVRALSASISVSTEEKRRIVGILVLVLLIYMLLFLPMIIWFMENGSNINLNYVSLTFFKLSPLADLVVYVFMRKGAVDKLLAAVCCCRMDSSDISRSTE